MASEAGKTSELAFSKETRFTTLYDIARGRAIAVRKEPIWAIPTLLVIFVAFEAYPQFLQYRLGPKLKLDTKPPDRIARLKDLAQKLKSAEKNRAGIEYKLEHCFDFIGRDYHEDTLIRKFRVIKRLRNRLTHAKPEWTGQAWNTSGHEPGTPLAVCDRDPIWRDLISEGFLDRPTQALPSQNLFTAIHNDARLALRVFNSLAELIVFIHQGIADTLDPNEVPILINPVPRGAVTEAEAQKYLTPRS